MCACMLPDTYTLADAHARVRTCSSLLAQHAHTDNAPGTERAYESARHSVALAGKGIGLGLGLGLEFGH